MKVNGRFLFVLASFALLLLVSSALAYTYYVGNTQPADQNEGMMCDMPSMSAGMSEHDHHAMMAQTAAVAGQEQEQEQEQEQGPPRGQGGQPGDTPTHRYSPGDGCSSVNPNAPNKELNGVKPNTVGCTCVRKCVNGNVQEDLSLDEKGVYVCKNACHKDRCSCPDPCKT